MVCDRLTYNIRTWHMYENTPSDLSFLIFKVHEIFVCNMSNLKCFDAELINGNQAGGPTQKLAESR